MNTLEIKMLAQVERDMDSGKQPFVIYAGDRLAVMQETMDEIELVTGQTISKNIFVNLMQMQLAQLRTELAIQKAQKA